MMVWTAALLLCACSNEKPIDPVQEPLPSPTDVGEVLLAGVIRPADAVAIRSMTEGRVVLRAAEPGSQVKRGDTLLEVDTSELRLRQADATAQLALAHMRLSRLLPGGIDHASAERRSNYAESAYRQKERTLRENEELHTRGIISRDELEVSRLDAHTARDERDAARQALGGGRGDKAVDFAHAELSVARQRLEDIKARIHNATVRAPTDGIFLALYHVGASESRQDRDSVTFSEVIGYIASGNKLFLETLSTESDRAQFSAGDPAVVFRESPADGVKACVTRVSDIPVSAAAADPTRTNNAQLGYSVRVDLTAIPLESRSPLPFRIGNAARVAIRTRSGQKC